MDIYLRARGVLWVHTSLHIFKINYEELNFTMCKETNSLTVYIARFIFLRGKGRYKCNIKKHNDMEIIYSYQDPHPSVQAVMPDLNNI